MGEKDNKRDADHLDLAPANVLARCLAQSDLASAIAMHEKYYLHRMDACGKPLAAAKARIDELKAEIARISASALSARNENVQLAFADSGGREAIEKHFAARKAARGVNGGATAPQSSIPFIPA